MQSINVCPAVASTFIRTADGTTHLVNAQYNLQVSYCAVVKSISILYVPSVPKLLILGMDFWKAFNIKPVIIETIESEKSIPLSNDHILKNDQAQKLQSILKGMPFSQDGKLSKTHLITHSIDTGNAAPIKQRHYIVSPYVQKDINVEIDRLLKLDVIEACEPGAWSSPLVVVKKATGKVRLCLDARKLNAVTIKDAYPQQQINRILGRLAGTRVLSSIDFSDAFLQVPLESNSQPKTAFAISGRGYFKYKRMAFGLCNSGATLCRLVDRVIGCDLEPHVFVYLDDIIVATDSFSKHFDILAKLSERIKAAGLTISVAKSRFCMKSLKYLGYIVSEDGVRPDPDKIAPIENYPIPKSVKDVRRLLGLAGWYRRFIPDFATITAPITNMLKKGQPKIEWSNEARDSLEKIKKCLTSSPVLANPNYELPFIIQTDASDVGMGGILVQGEGEDERVVAYWSLKLSAAQRKYQTTERECLAVIMAVEKFRPYIEGTSFTVITDHASLLWLQNLKDPTGRLGRWALRLQPYDFVLKHRKGKFMVVADALSRNVEVVDVRGSSNDAWYNKLMDSVSKSPGKYPQFRIVDQALQKHCANGGKGMNYNATWRTVIPSNDRPAILFKCHDAPLSAHGGIFKTTDRVKRQYYWPKMEGDIRKYVSSCEVCKASKPTNQTQRSPMGKQRSANRPFEVISIDYVGPLPRSRAGFSYLFVVLDSFSKFTHLHPMRAANTQSTIKCLKEHIFLTFGTPRYLISDNGTQFTAVAFQNFLKAYGVTSWYTSRYHPQANATEAANKTVESSIRAYLKDSVNHKDWDVYVPEIACAMNTSKHTSTLLSPYFVIFGTHMQTSGNNYPAEMQNDRVGSDTQSELSETDRRVRIRKLVKENLSKNYDQSKRRYDLRSREIKYNVGDVVWVKNRVLSNAIKGITAKLSPLYKKCTVVRKIGSNSYEVADEFGKAAGIYNTDCFKE